MNEKKIGDNIKLDDREMNSCWMWEVGRTDTR
jgi:hypothetical protein